jgi:predicted ATPase
MLTRLKVNGFKNLMDVDVRFGPFTCIAGPNGVGKSNLFDAILFLSALADQPLLEAAASVRGGAAPASHPGHLFHSVGATRSSEMSFEAEMLVPPEGEDDLGQPASAAITFLRYRLVLTLHDNAVHILDERLDYITKGRARKNLVFPHKLAWRESVIIGRRTAPLISTKIEDGIRTILLHQDQGEGYKGGGKPRPHAADRLPRTVLSTASAAEGATALLARREMQSWRLLQLEPSAMRTPDPFHARDSLGINGAHLPATLARIARIREGRPEEIVLARVANRVAELVEDVRTLRIDIDERRELLTLMLTSFDGTEHEARSLSDGTLRFLALAVLQEDPQAHGLICLEEPENGIHPRRIPAMLRLLNDIAFSPDEPIDSENPLRQVMVNTHSPAVIAQVDDEDLLLAQLKRVRLDNRICERPVFRCLSDTWRNHAEPQARTATRGDVVMLLNPVPPQTETGPSRVIDRDECQRSLPFQPVR